MVGMGRLKAIMLLVRKKGELAWRSPKQTAYPEEAALQSLIEQSPELLPGSSGVPMAVVNEIAIPQIGNVDLVGVDAVGNITLVECKLRANPEIRRRVVGQIFAYAAGLWGLTYEEFDAAFAARAGAPMAQRVAAAGVEEWDEEAFRANVAANLAGGRFRLVIAVDEITDELKGIVRYINQHTNSDIQFLAIELRYSADDGFEILVPAVYGEESIQSKGAATTAKQKWDEQSVFAALEKICSPAGFAAAKRLYDFSKEHARGFTWSVGPYASVTIRFPVGGKLSSALSLYEWPQGRGAFAINFEYIAGYATPEALTRLADQVRAIPGVGEYLVGLEQAGFRKRPSLPIDPLLAQPGAVERIMAALNELMASETGG